MRKLIFLIFIFHFSNSFSQFRSDDTHILAKYSFGNDGSARYVNYGLQMELFLGDHFSANYNFDLSYSSDNIRHLHTPLGIIGGPPLILIGLLSLRNDSSTGYESDSSAFNLGGGGALLGLLLLVAPDGFAFHIPIGKRVDISPYFNFLGLDFIRNRTTDQHWIKYSVSLGARLTYLHKSGITLSTFAEWRKAVRFQPMKGIGIGIGYYF